MPSAMRRIACGTRLTLPCAVPQTLNTARVTTQVVDGFKVIYSRGELRRAQRRLCCHQEIAAAVCCLK